MKIKRLSDSTKRVFYWMIIKTSRNNKITRFLIDYVALCYYKIFRSGKVFLFNNKSYNYFYHIYNRTVAGERVVEIPVAKDLLNSYEGKNILEVGNVMSHYFPIQHKVLDKYEEGEGVINEDVVNYRAKEKYDLILSVSTLEHVGFSYGESKDNDKFLKGVKNLIKLLKPGGLLFATFPVFLNEGINKLVLDNKMPFQKEFYLKRVSFLNEWKQVKRKEALKGDVYDKNYANANILYVGYYRRINS